MSSTNLLTRSRRSTTALVVATAALALGLAPSPAVAHSTLLESLPRDGAVLGEPPAEIKLRFNEEVSVVEEATSLNDEDGSAVATEISSDGEVVTITPVEALPAGEYDLAYRVVSADSHPIGGTVGFEVEAPATPDATPTVDEDETTVDDPAATTTPAADAATDDGDDESSGVSVMTIVLAGLAGLLVGLFLHLRNRNRNRK